MARCDVCGQDMKVAATCNAATFLRDGAKVRRVKFQGTEGSRCGDCGVRPGGYHHEGCLKEFCPICGGQLMTCGHWDHLAEDEDDEDDSEDPLGYGGYDEETGRGYNCEGAGGDDGPGDHGG